MLRVFVLSWAMFMYPFAVVWTIKGWPARWAGKQLDKALEAWWTRAH